MVYVTTAEIISLFVDSLFAFIAVVLVDSVIEHNVGPKRAIILSLAAFFATPLIGKFIAVGSYGLGGFIYLVFPALVWFVLGELLLEESSMIEKLKVLAIAYVVWYISSTFASGFITGIINSLLPF